MQGSGGEKKGRRLLGRPEHRWEEIIIDLAETGWNGVGWTDLVPDRANCWAFVNMVMNSQVP
jgi:hypothetical protein